jgi:hypothetical protein
MTCVIRSARTRARYLQWYARCVGFGLALMLGLFGASPVAAEALGGPKLQELALGGVWASENDWGFWEWHADNTVCLRVNSAEGDCDDHGTWSLDGNVLCYELEWYGRGEDVRKNCFTVHALDDNKYKTVLSGGAVESMFFVFKVID